MKNPRETWVLIPAHNEEKNINGIIKGIKRHTDNIIVIDDCSTDNTYKNAVLLASEVIRNNAMGKGSAIRKGISWLMKNQRLKGDDIVIIMDADGQHDPSYIPEIIRNLDRGFDMIVGKRNLKKYPVYKRIGNFIMNAIASLLSGQDIKDSECGFRGFRYGTLVSVFGCLKSKGYEIEMETNIAVGLNRGKIKFIEMEVPFYKKGAGVSNGVMNVYRGIKLWYRMVFGD